MCTIGNIAFRHYLEFFLHWCQIISMCVYAPSVCVCVCVLCVLVSVVCLSVCLCVTWVAVTRESQHLWHQDLAH